MRRALGASFPQNPHPTPMLDPCHPPGVVARNKLGLMVGHTFRQFHRRSPFAFSEVSRRIVSINATPVYYQLTSLGAAW